MSTPTPQRPRALTKIVTENTDLNRVQDHILAVLNPVLKNPITASPPTVTGSKGGNAALASLVTALASLGLIKDGTS